MINTRFPAKVSCIVRLDRDSTVWYWAIRWRKNEVIAEGTARTEEEGHNKLAEALGQFAKGYLPRATARSKTRLQLNHDTDRRPYIACHIADLLLSGPTSLERICREAAVQERALYEVEHKEFGALAIPPPTHPLTKPASEVAERIVRSMVALGIAQLEGDTVTTRKRFKEWTRSIGGRFAPQVTEPKLRSVK